MGLGPVEYVGELPPYFRVEIERVIASALDRGGVAPVGLPTDECEQLECVRQAAAQAGLDVFVMSYLLHENRDYELKFIAYAVADQRALAQTKVDCSICGQQELLDAIPAKLIELEAKIAQSFAAQTGPARITVDGTPARALLTLDGHEIGSSPVTLEVGSGNHQLRINARGHTAQVHRWTAANGVEERIEYTLTRTPSSARGVQIGGWVAVSLGIAGTGTGIALAALDGHDHGPSCRPERLDINAACPNVYTTGTAGYVSLGVGVAAIATGVSLLIHHRPRKAKPTSARVDVGVGVGGLRLQF
jgi:hypothetical protein